MGELYPTNHSQLFWEAIQVIHWKDPTHMNDSFVRVKSAGRTIKTETKGRVEIGMYKTRGAMRLFSDTHTAGISPRQLSHIGWVTMTRIDY